MPDKNGANRGGARPGAGRKKKPLTERIEAGQKAVVMKIPDVETAQMPKIRDYFKAEQRQGELYAAEIYQETWQWLQERGCATLINPMLLEQYAMSAARWVQLEGINSEYGFITKSAQGVITASPFVAQAQAYMKQTNQLWYQIYHGSLWSGVWKHERAYQAADAARSERRAGAWRSSCTALVHGQCGRALRSGGKHQDG